MHLKGKNQGQPFIIVILMIICSFILFVNPSISVGSFKFPKWPLVQRTEWDTSNKAQMPFKCHAGICDWKRKRIRQEAANISNRITQRFCHQGSDTKIGISIEEKELTAAFSSSISSLFPAVIAVAKLPSICQEAPSPSLFRVDDWRQNTGKKRRKMYLLSLCGPCRLDWINFVLLLRSQRCVGCDAEKKKLSASGSRGSWVSPLPSFSGVSPGYSCSPPTSKANGRCWSEVCLVDWGTWCVVPSYLLRRVKRWDADRSLCSL